MSFLGGLIVSGLAASYYADSLDDKARKTYAKAYDRQFSAQIMANKKKEEAENSILKFANRKRAILMTSIPDFLELYSVIKKINFVESDGIRELEKKLLLPENVESLKLVVSKCGRMVRMTDEELVKSLVISRLLLGSTGYSAGILMTDIFVKESAQRLKNAQAQNKASRVTESQAKTVEVALQGIIDRSERLSDLLSNMNLLFVKSIKICKVIVDRNGIDKEMYTVQDRKYLMNCLNFAVAVKNIIDVPLLDAEGHITEQSLKALEVGEVYLREIRQFY